MPYPLHSPGSLRVQRTISEAELTDVVTLTGIVRVRQPNGEYVDTPFTSDPIAGWLGAMGAAQVEIAAARGIEASWALHLPIGTVVRPGNTATVERATDDEAWTRVVKVTGVDLPAGVHVTCTAVDTQLNQ